LAVKRDSGKTFPRAKGKQPYVEKLHTAMQLVVDAAEPNRKDELHANRKRSAA